MLIIETNKQSEQTIELIESSSEQKNNISINLDNHESKRTLNNKYKESFQDRLQLLSKVRKKLNNRFYDDILPFINFNLPLFDNNEYFDLSIIEQLKKLLNKEKYYKGLNVLGSIFTEKNHNIYFKPTIEYLGVKSLPYLKLLVYFECTVYPYDVFTVYDNLDLLSNKELKNIIYFHISFYNINDLWDKRISSILSHAMSDLQANINQNYSDNIAQKLYIKDMLRKND